MADARTKRWAARLCLRPVLAALVLSALIACAATPALRAEPPPARAQTEAIGRMSIPDPILLDQDGREVRFYSDLVKGHVVAVNFIFTTCTTICPPMGANFSKVQKLLKEGSGRDVQLLSVSIDPAVDTPPRLKAWAAKFGAGPGWTLVTGLKPDIVETLKALQAFTPEKADHSPIILVGNEPEGLWKKVYGLAPATDIVNVIESVITD